MKRIYHLFFLLLFVFTCGSVDAQNIIYQKIEQAKNNGKKFDQVKDIFTRTESNRELLRAFKNPEEVNFMSYNSSSVDELPMTISLEIMLENKWETLELMAVDNDFYNYVVTTSANESFGANRDIKHYRGVLKGNDGSLAAVSFSKDHVGGVVSNGKGNYNISLPSTGNTVVIFNGNNLLDTPSFKCGTVDDGMADYDAAVLNMQSKTELASNEKCVRFYLETEYDIYQNKGSILNVESYISTIFNQAALLFENENITTTISELKIWDQSDPYNGATTDVLLNEFKNNITYMNGDLGQLLTFREVGGGRAYLNVLCDPNHSKRTSVSGLYSSSLINTNYTWNVMVITHEFGHSLGSPHTHACAWNLYNSNGVLLATNVPLDRCGPNAGYGFEGSCSTTFTPIKGTIMSYCHLSGNPGISFVEGFGLQPGNLIRSRVNSRSCSSGCSQYCFEDLELTSTVPLNYLDKRTVINNITARNSIVYGAYAEYSAGNSIRLLPPSSSLIVNAVGFHAKSGSTVHLKIESCNQMQGLGSSVAEVSQSSESKTLYKEELSVSLYPNPTPDLITIESNQEIVFWELTNDVGNMYRSGKVEKLKKFQLNFSDLNIGIYNIKIHLMNGEVSYKKMIKK